MITVKSTAVKLDGVVTTADLGASSDHIQETFVWAKVENGSM